MNFLNFDFRKAAILAFLVAIPLLSVNMQQRSKDRPWILQPFYFAAGITQDSYSSFSSGVRSTVRMYINLIGIKKDNEKLQKDISELQAKLSQMEELKRENERFNQLLEFRGRASSQLVPARIIGRDLLPDYDTITIDRGAKNGVAKGMAVVAVNGAVGYAIQVEENSSQILLLTDRYAVVDAIVQRSRVRGIVNGHAKDTCTLNYLNANDDVQVGDRIVTSGLDNIFPKGFPIGTVVSVQPDEYSLGKEVEIEPTVRSTNLEEVFVVAVTKEEEALLKSFEPAEPATSPESATTTTEPAQTTTDLKTEAKPSDKTTAKTETKPPVKTEAKKE